MNATSIKFIIFWQKNFYRQTHGATLLEDGEKEKK